MGYHERVVLLHGQLSPPSRTVYLSFSLGSPHSYRALTCCKILQMGCPTATRASAEARQPQRRLHAALHRHGGFRPVYYRQPPSWRHCASCNLVRSEEVTQHAAGKWRSRCPGSLQLTREDQAQKGSRAILGHRPRCVLHTSPTTSHPTNQAPCGCVREPLLSP